MKKRVTIGENDILDDTFLVSIFLDEVFQFHTQYEDFNDILDHTYNPPKRKSEIATQNWAIPEKYEDFFSISCDDYPSFLLLQIENKDYTPRKFPFQFSIIEKTNNEFKVLFLSRWNGFDDRIIWNPNIYLGELSKCVNGLGEDVHFEYENMDSRYADEPITFLHLAIKKKSSVSLKESFQEALKIAENIVSKSEASLVLNVGDELLPKTKALILGGKYDDQFNYKIILKIHSELKTAFKQYFEFFDDYVNATKKRPVGIFIEKVEEGLVIRIKDSDEDLLNDFNDQFSEYLGFLKQNIDNVKPVFEFSASEGKFWKIEFELKQQIKILELQLDSKVQMLTKMNTEIEKYDSIVTKLLDTINFIAVNKSNIYLQNNLSQKNQDIGQVNRVKANKGSQINLAEKIKNVEWNERIGGEKRDFDQLLNEINSLSEENQIRLVQKFDEILECDENERKGILKKVKEFLIRNGVPTAQSYAATVIFELLKAIMK